jgi:hypothetical protein
MTTAEQKQYGRQYDGVDNDTLKRIVQDVRDWDAAYTEGAKIERVLKKIECHLDRIESKLAEANKNESVRERRRERAENVNELRLLNELGYEINREQLGWIVSSFYWVPDLIRTPREETPHE